jgi:hypothetical protein
MPKLCSWRSCSRETRRQMSAVEADVHVSVGRDTVPLQPAASNDRAKTAGRKHTTYRPSRCFEVPMEGPSHSTLPTGPTREDTPARLVISSYAY